LSAREHSPARIALLVFVLSLVYFVSFIKYGLPYDEGYVLDGVEKIMEGQVIYRDFHHTYAPGRFYLIAAAFEVAGKNIFVERFILALLQALKCMLAYLIVRRITGSRYAYLAPLLIIAAPGPWHKVFFGSLGLLVVYFIMRALQRDDTGSYLWAGIVAGVCAAFRQDVAAFAVVGGAAAVAVCGFKERRGAAYILKRWVWMVAAACAVVAAVLAYFYARGALGAMIHKIVAEGMRDNVTNRIPYPSLAPRGRFDWTYLWRIAPVKAMFYMPPVVYALSACLAVWLAVKSTARIRYASMICLTITSVLAFNQAAWRSDISHLLQSMQYVFVLTPVLVWVADRFFRERASGWPLILMRTAFFAVPVAFILWATSSAVYATREGPVLKRFMAEGIPIGDTEYVGSFLVMVGNSALLESDRAPVYVTPREARIFSEVKSFLDANTQPGDYVLAVPQLQIIYFLFDRRNPTRYAHYRRALEPEEERLYIEDIKRHDTRFILLVEPAASPRLVKTRDTFAEYAANVRAWIMDNYVPVGRIATIQLLRRKT
jgi:hypothetical protein